MGLESVGLKDVKLPHTSMIAFSERSNYFARNARLNAIAGYPGYGGWWPTSNDLNQWLQVNLNKWTKFTRWVWNAPRAHADVCRNSLLFALATKNSSSNSNLEEII